MSDENRRMRYQDGDIISNLPDSIIESILMCMPTRDAARTCILSSKWRNMWWRLPQVKLETSMLQQSNNISKEFLKAKFATMVCQILAFHQGPITKFILNIPDLESCLEIDTLIYFISRNGVEELVLYVSPYKVPSSLFSCTQLRKLVLRNCSINTLPSTFTGFNRLIWLQLDMSAQITYQVLGCLISLCPLLEIFILSIGLVHGQGNLEINAPKLRSLGIIGLFPNPGGRSPNNKLIDKLPALEILHMNYNSMKYFAAGGSPTRLPNSLLHLKDIKLKSICLDEVDLFSYTLFLIRSSPNLQRLYVTVLRNPMEGDANDVLEYLKSQAYSDMTLNHLAYANLQYITGTKSEMEFIKLLLAKSPTLKKVIIQPNTSALSDQGLKLVKELNKFERASPNVQVIIED